MNRWLNAKQKHLKFMHIKNNSVSKQWEIDQKQYILIKQGKNSQLKNFF
jgi:hypothetical protein